MLRSVRFGSAPARDFALGPTGGWSSDQDDWQVAWLDGAPDATFPLTIGEHALDLRADGQVLNLDWLELVPVLPAASP